MAPLFGEVRQFLGHASRESGPNPHAPPLGRDVVGEPVDAMTELRVERLPGRLPSGIGSVSENAPDHATDVVRDLDAVMPL